MSKYWATNVTSSLYNLYKNKLKQQSNQRRKTSDTSTVRPMWPVTCAGLDTATLPGLAGRRPRPHAGRPWSPNPPEGMDFNACRRCEGAEAWCR